MLKKALSYGILLISTGIGIGIATSFKDIVDLHRRKVNTKHQENVNYQRLTLYNEIAKKFKPNDAEAMKFVNEHIDIDEDS